MKRDDEPPGGVLVWIIVLLELLTFGAGIGVFLVEGKADPLSFEIGKGMLQQNLALTNTLVLLTGGWCMALCLENLRHGRPGSAWRWIMAAMATGMLFLILKGVEYAGKINHGIGFGNDTFFTLYYALTGFHMIHVLVAIVVLAFMARGIRRGVYARENHFDVESSGIFWHMCDLIWLLLYPVIYLL